MAYAVSIRDLKLFSQTIAFFRIMTRIIKPFKDAHTRTLNAWTVLQFRKAGYNIKIPLEGAGFNIPEGDTVPRLELTAILNFMSLYSIPFFRFGSNYDLDAENELEVSTIDDRKLNISIEEYQELLVTAIREEIQYPTEETSTCSFYSGLYLLSWLEDSPYPPVKLT